MSHWKQMLNVKKDWHFWEVYEEWGTRSIGIYTVLMLSIFYRLFFLIFCPQDCFRSASGEVYKFLSFSKSQMTNLSKRALQSDIPVPGPRRRMRKNFHGTKREETFRRTEEDPSPQMDGSNSSESAWTMIQTATIHETEGGREEGPRRQEAGGRTTRLNASRKRLGPMRPGRRGRRHEGGRECLDVEPASDAGHSNGLRSEKAQRLQGRSRFRNMQLIDVDVSIRREIGAQCILKRPPAAISL